MSETIDVGSSYLAWYDDDGEGAIIGQSIRVIGSAFTHDWESAARWAFDQSEREYRAVEVAALEFATRHPDEIVFNRGTGGWNIDNARKTVIVAFLRHCRAAFKNAKRDAPWPAWAVQAAAAGWKPPKCWKPT